MSSVDLLLVDDRPENLTALSALLERPDRVLHTATSGEEALRVMMRQDFAVVLLDVQMPGMDGFEVARLMRRRRQTAETPIIFVTAFSREERNVLAGYDAGAVDYLFKPLVPEIVRSKVDVFVQLYRQRRELAELNRTLEQRVQQRTAELLAEEERYRALVEQLPVVVYVVDLEGAGPGFVSPRIQELLGVSPEAWMADPSAWRDRLHPEDREEVLSRVAAARAARAPFRGEYRLLRGDGSSVWVRDEALVTTDPRDGRAQVRGVLLDVNEARELRMQVERSQRLESVGQLSVGLAHDFNNLLGVILGFSSLLLAEEPPPDKAGPLAEIQQAAERGASITHRMLSFARNQGTQPRALDLAAYLRDAQAVLGRVLPQTIELRFEVPPAPTWVRCDPVALEQIVLNLAINARDAMEGAGRLQLVARAEDVRVARVLHAGTVTPGRWQVLEVRDSGPGIDEATQERLFEPFFTTKPVGRGTGLGLSSSLGIMQQLGGAIGVRSQPGEGTAFELWFPRAEPPTHAPVAALTDRLERPGRGERVLVIEDEDSLRDLLVRALGSQGFDAVGAADGARGLETLAAGGPFDLLMTDLTMPGMSGLEVLEAMRSSHPALPAILLSGAAQPQGLGTLAPVRFIQKPLRPSRLAAAVREMIDGQEDET